MDRSDIDMDMLKVRRGWFTAPRHEWSVEVCRIRMDAGTDTDSLTYAATGNFRQYVTVEPQRALYWELGVGLCHIENTIPELATHTNFVEQLGIGVQWPTGHDASWGIEYRFQHVSNAGRKDPNIGLNSSLLSIGYTAYH